MFSLFSNPRAHERTVEGSIRFASRQGATPLRLRGPLDGTQWKAKSTGPPRRGCGQHAAPPQHRSTNPAGQAPHGNGHSPGLLCCCLFYQVTELLWKTSWLLRRTKEITWHKKGESESRHGDPEKSLARSRHNGRGRLTFLPSAGKRRTKNRRGVTRYLRRQIALSAIGKLQHLSRDISIYCNRHEREKK